MSEKNTSQKQYIKKRRETLIGADSKRPQAQKGMGGPRGVITESSDNFGASWKNLLSYAKPQMVAIVIAMLCAVIGTVISLIGPKQIQKITAVFVGVSLDGSCEADRDDIGISPGDCDPMTCSDRCVRPSLLLSSDIGFRIEISLGHICGFRLSLGPVRRSTGCGRQIRLSLRCGELPGFVFVHSSTS